MTRTRAWAAGEDAGAIDRASPGKTSWILREEMPMSPIELNRRALMGGTAVAGMFAALSEGTGAAAQAAGTDNAPADTPVAAELRVNGKSYRVELDVRATLLDALRERIGLTGTKKG